jgi:4-hydroxybenzoate polyprenyltransferase
VGKTLAKIRSFLDMIDFGHSLFGLPFAYLGAFLAIKGAPTWPQLGWITVAMVSARTAALCLNRVIDLDFDSRNPRTQHWVMVKGDLPVGLVWAAAVLCTLILLFSAWKLNPLCLKLAPLAIFVLWGYSYTKRFTWWCHIILGLAIGIGPVGGWIAVTGHWAWTPFVLGLAVATWIAGFDTMYACQDIEFDRQQGLYSIPARFGERGALRISGFLHLLTIVFLVLNGCLLELGAVYYAGVAGGALVLLIEHHLVEPRNLTRVDLASFRLNRFVGLMIFVATLIDIFYFPG